MISQDIMACSAQVWRPSDGCNGCQCNQIHRCSFHSDVVTVEPGNNCSAAYDNLREEYRSSPGDECAFVLSINELLVEYSKHLNSETRTVVSGGLQQLLNKKAMASGTDNPQPRKGAGSDSTTFHDLPDSLQLHIFSYLGARELCGVARVCHHWFMLTSDDLLWHRLLDTDVHRWTRISHTTLPTMYTECQSDWSNKQIYLKCSPEINELRKQDNLSFHNLSSILRSFLPRKTPKFAMFGPGLESSTSGIARKILEDTTGVFTVKGMFPGISEGVGSGFTMSLPSATTFHLCMLYTTTRHEREQLAAAAAAGVGGGGGGGEQRLAANRMLVHNAAMYPDSPDADAPRFFEVQPAVRQLCRTLDGFIFVVDASSHAQTVRSSVPELKAMLNEVWASPNVPLLVLGAVRDGSTKRKRSAVEIAEDLSLAQLHRPWQVENCVVDTMEGVTEAIQWAVEVAQRQ